jgi:hypothetical protein
VAYPPLYGHGFLYLGFAFPFSSVFKKKKHEKRGRKENRIALEEEKGCDKSDYGTRDILMEPTWI